MDKKFLAVLLIIVGVFVGYLLVSKQDSVTTVQASATNHVTGAGNKKVTLIEYGDFQCPVCGQYYSIIEQIKEKYGDDITFQYRHFPLDTIHPNARAAHRAAEAAGRQNKFFEMYDLLYQNIQVWSDSSNAKSLFEGYATQIGLNMDTFKSDVDSQDLNAVINADIEEGKKIGVTGTPTFVLNGRTLEDNERRGFNELVATIDAEIVAQNK